MTSEQRRQESEAYWFRSPAARNVLEDFGAVRDDEEETILTEEGQEPEPVTLTPETTVEDVVRNEPEPPPQEFTDVYQFFASKQGKDALQERYEEQGIEGYEVGQLFPREQRGLGAEAGAGFARGVDQTQAMGFGLLGLMGEALGVEGLSDLGVDGYIRNMEEAAKNQASVQDPFEEIGGAGDAARYATGIIFEQIPQLTLSLLGGGVGGFTARTIANKVVANEIGRRVKAGLAKEVAESEVAQLVAERMLRGAGAKIVESATKSGALGGAYVANVGQIAGGSFGEIEQETGLRDPVNALGFALLGGALETGAEALLAAPIAGKLMRGTTAPLTGATERAMGFNVGPVVGTAGRLAGTSAAEGGTEYGQTFTEQAAVASADPNRTLAEVAFTPEAERERQIAAAAGVVAGGGFGAASQAASYLIPETSRAVARKVQQTQAEQAPAEPTLTGEWSQPIQVDDLRMQRSSTGLWAVVNPDREIVRGAPTIQDESGATLQILAPEADEEGRAAMLVAKAEKALSDLSEGELTTELPTQQEEVVEEDELGEPAELDEEAEATRLRQSLIGAQALRRQLAEDEEVSATLAEPAATVVEQPAQPIKSAEESAQTIAAELDREEELRRSDEGAEALRRQLAEEEEVSAALADTTTEPRDAGTATVLKPAAESAAVIEGAAQQDRALATNEVEASYLRRRLAFEESQSQRKQNADEALARPQTQAVAFVEGLNTGDRVGLLLGGTAQEAAGTTGVFVGRRKNGNAVFEASDLSPVSGSPIGQKTRVELSPSQFRRVILAPPPEVTKTPLEQAFADALGPNPTKQQAERVLGSPYTGTRGAQESTFSDGLGTEAFPIEVSWFNKKGEKGTIIPSIRGKFTNSPFNTVRQMNQGLEVIVPDDQLPTLNKDIEVQAVSDKKGGRKNIVTGVNLWGRTYRRGLNSPKNFSVDIPLTSKGATSRRRGLLLFDNIYKNSPERIARSEAAVRGREERQTPVEEQLKEWELVQAGLNPVEYTFYEDALARVTDFISRSNLPENVKDEARFEAQNSVVKAFANRKKRRGKQPAGDTADLSKIYLETLAGLRQKRLQDARQRATRLIGNIERNPERMSEVEIARADDASPLRGPVLGSVAGQRAAEVEERAIDEAEKGNAVDLDRAVQATLKRLAELRPDRTTKQVFNDRAAVRAIAETYKNLGKFNPIYTAMNAVRTADRSIRRREMNEQTELITDREARERAGRQRAEEPATTQEFAQGELARAEQAETVQSADRAAFPEQAEPEANEDAVVVSQPDEPLSEDFEAARERFYNLSDGDRDLIFRFERQILDERGRPVRGQKSDLTQAQKRRAKLIRRYIKEGGAELESQINEGRPRTNRGSAVPADANISGGSAVGRELSGANRSLARGTAATATQGRPESVGGPDRGGAGTATGAGVRGDGRPGVRASLAPTTVRQLSRRAKRIFIQSFGRLTDAESAALADAEIDRAYQSIITRSNPAAVKAGKSVFGETPNSFADLAGLSASELLAGANAARRSAEEVRNVRENVGELLRARAFADVGTFLETVQQGRFSQDMKLRAREFAKLARRGVDLNGVGVQIARFGGDTSWAGLFTRDGNNAYDIALNLDSRHDRDSAVNTFLHELSHVTTSKKVRGEVKLNRVEQDALNRLEALRREALVAAARDLRLDVPATLTDADYERLARDLDNRTLPQNDPEGQNRAYAGLTNLEEFTTEVSSNPELADLMVRLGFGQAKGRVSLLNAVRDAWNALVELIAGIKADPNSPLAKAFKDSWIINFSNAGGDVNLGEYTMPEVRRSAINMELELINEAENFINREIETRNLEGTTEQRQAIAERFARRSPAASAKRVRDAARSMTEPQFVQWASDNGFNFVDPAAVWRNNNTTTDQGPRDTVQVAESRAVGSQVAVVSDGGVDKEFHTLNTVEDVNGDVTADLSKLIGSMRDRASQVSGEVFGKKFLAIIDGERREFTALPALQKFLAAAGVPDGTVARVFRNANNQIAVNFDEDISQATSRAIREQARDVAESRARSRVLYHAGPSVLTPETVRFDRGAMGFHVGARTQAEWVSKEAIKDQMSSFAVKDSTDKFYTEDIDTDMSWEHADALLVELVSKGLINKEDAIELAETWDDLSNAHEKALMADLNRVQFEDGYVGLDGNVGEFMLQSPTYKNREKLSQIRELLKTYAIGAINYVNEVEGVGGDSQAVAVLDSSMLERPAVALESRARRRAISETDTTITGKTYTRPGLFAGQVANLDSRGQELVEIKKRMEKQAEKFTEMMGKELRNIIKRTYKDEPVPVNLINDALGNLDNPLTDEQFEIVKRLEARDKAAAVKQHMAFLSENRERFRRERQAPALLALPEELAGFLREMGDELTALQKEALRLGIPKGDMRVAFTENLGIYLTRSYAAFLDQEGWEKALRAEDRAVGEQSRMGQMRNQIRATMISERASEFMAEAMEQGRTLSRAEAERRASEGTTTEEVDQILETYIAYTKQEPSSETFSGFRFPGRQRVKDLKNRKVLSDALRQFYGQTENPAVNFTVSYMKLSTMLANHKFQDSLRKMGLEEGWIWDPEDPRNEGQRPPPGFTRIAADSDKSLELLAGLFARQDLVDGLREALPSNALEESVWWLHPFMKYTGFSMGMKTVGSIAAQVRNYWSSYAPLIAGGNFTAADLFRKDWRANWKFAHQTALASVFRNYGGNRKQMIDDIRFLYEQGVMGESVTVGLLGDLTQLGKNSALSDDEFLQGFEKYMRRPGKKAWDRVKQFWKKTEQVYGMTDDIFKIFTYLSELDKYRKVYPNKPIEELRRDAASRSRDIHWTYSKAPAIVNELKKFPFIAPFVTFTTETIRITLNIGRLAASERRQGQELRARGEREGNAELVRQGNELLAISNKRIRGMAAVALGPWAIGTMALSAAGLSGDDEEDLRQFLPDWQKNSQLIILGRNGGEVNYVDVSYLDPFEVWKKPFTAFMRGMGRANNPEEFFTEAVVGAAIQAASPFTSEQILSGAVMDIMRNRDANGRQVYNPQDTADSISFAVGKKLASAFAPGTYDTGDRILKAFGGSVSETGRDYNFWNELGGIPAGSRVSAVNAEQALGFKASQFLRARREARNIFNRDYLSQGTRSESDIISAYQRSNAGLRDVTERLRREYRAALNLGVSPAKARTLLKAAGLDRDTVRSISTGFYRRLTPSEEQNRIAPADRRRAVRQAMSETPDREVMLD